METPPQAPPRPLTGMCVVGIDVAKAWLNVTVRPIGSSTPTGTAREPWRSENHDTAISRLVEQMRALAPQSIVLEATGGYERLVVARLAEAGLPVAVVNPRQVRDFAKATGRLAKTDRLDAQVLAHFAKAVYPEPRLLPDEASRQLVALLERRSQLVGVLCMLTAERNRQAQALKSARPLIAQHIAWLEQALEELDQTLQASPVWREREQLLAERPELGTLAHKQLAALVGLAPLNRDCGAQHARQRTISLLTCRGRT